MGGGGGPGREIPEQVIQDALNNGEDFTLRQNETTTLTQNLTVPAETTLTIEGTIDLGDGNTFQIVGDGEVIVTGSGIITNAASNIKVVDTATLQLQSGADILIDGNLELEDDSRLKVVFTASKAQTRINVNVFSITGNATFEYEGVDTGATGLELNAFDLLLSSIPNEQLDEMVSTAITIKEGGELTIEDGSELKLDDRSELVLLKDATMNCEGTLSLGCNPRKNTDDDKFPQFSISNLGQINVTGKGKIIGLTETETILGNDFINGEITAVGKILVKGTEASIQNVSIANNEIVVGDVANQVGENGKIILGEAGDDFFDTLTSSVIGFTENEATAAPGGISFDSEASVKIYSEKGIVYLDPESADKPDGYEGIKYNNSGEKQFPQGAETNEGLVFTYTQANNPGFDIPYDTIQGPSGPCVSRLDNLNNDANKLIAINN